MEIQPRDGTDDHAAGETPEDIAIMYSWANPEGAKYRDSSANRREYRAQMRHRAAEHLRLMELRAQSEAEAAAAEAEAEAAAAHAEADAASVKLAARRTMQAATAPVAAEDEQVEHLRRSSLREAAQQARRAAAERLEAARRAQAAALADSIARREEREIAEAQACALRPAAQYAEAEMRGRQTKTSQPDDSVPGQISDPYGPQVVAESKYFERPGTPVSELEASRFRQQRDHIEQNTGVALQHFRMPAAMAESAGETHTESAHRPREYRTDEPSGHRSPLRNESLTGHAATELPLNFAPRRDPKPLYEERYLAMARDAQGLDEARVLQMRHEDKRAADSAAGNSEPLRRVGVPSTPYKEFRRATQGGAPIPPEAVDRFPQNDGGEDSGTSPAAESLIGIERSQLRSEPNGNHQPLRANAPNERRRTTARVSPRRDTEPFYGGVSARSGDEVASSPVRAAMHQIAGNNKARTEAGALGSEPKGDFTRDSWGVAWEQPDLRGAELQPTWSSPPDDAMEEPVALLGDSSGPAWLYPKPHLPRSVRSFTDSGVRQPAQIATQTLKVESVQPAREAAPQTRAGAGENTLQHSREQVASRWFALKGVFAKADREQPTDKHLLREKKRDTPFVIVYSLAGGVGKTSLVATLGRALSSIGEKVLLTDTTSQGLLPFYFGGRELHSGLMRTFSPPDGSTDAPIHLVSYDFTAREKDPLKSESETHNEVLEDLLANSQRAHRVLIDMNAGCGWIVGRMAWMKPTILIPMAADMNSVISLQSVERSFSGLKDGEGKPLQPIYLLNQFDPSLPLHLDVREVLKQHLGNRLLPFVIRRAAAVSEALAEGMTIVDYDPESEAARDYMAVADWLRNDSAPATVGLRSLRWSER